MKVVAVSSALFVVFAALLIVIPSPAAAVTCRKRNSCATKDKENIGDETTKECDKCATWSCLLNGVLYIGDGCNGDSNICNGDANKCFITCLLPLGGSCIEELPCRLALKSRVTVTGECDPDNAGAGTTTTSKDGTKIGVFSIGGMILLGWVLARF